jgi:hypothetical protein
MNKINISTWYKVYTLTIDSFSIGRQAWSHLIISRTLMPIYCVKTGMKIIISVIKFNCFIVQSIALTKPCNGLQWLLELGMFKFIFLLPQLQSYHLQLTAILQFFPSMLWMIIIHVRNWFSNGIQAIDNGTLWPCSYLWCL